jgi:hypothetical protein
MDKICFIQQEIEGSFCDCRGVCVPAMITEQPVNDTPDSPVLVCESLDVAFDANTDGMWFVWRGYEPEDITGTPSGEYSGGIVNRVSQTSIHPSNGVARNLYPTSRTSVGWNNCNDEDVYFFNGNNTGAGSNLNHTRNTTVSPNYVGAADAHIQGGIYRPHFFIGSGNENARHELAYFSWRTFTFQTDAMKWNPVTGEVVWQCGRDSQDDSRAFLSCGGPDPNFVGYDENDTPIWRFIAWRKIRTASDVTVTVWKDGVESGTFVQNQAADGTPLQNTGWWALDDGSATRDPRAFVWAGGGGLPQRYKPWYITWAFCGDPNMETTNKFAEIQAAKVAQIGY